MSVRAGREFLAIPGPTTVPDEVLRAMHRPAVDIYSGPLLALTDSLMRDVARVFNTTGRAYIYISNGHGAWEAALSNVLTKGDKILVLESGRFAISWGENARRMGVEVEVLKGDMRRAVRPAEVEARLKADANPGQHHQGRAGGADRHRLGRGERHRRDRPGDPRGRARRAADGRCGGLAGLHEVRHGRLGRGRRDGGLAEGPDDAAGPGLCRRQSIVRARCTRRRGCARRIGTGPTARASSTTRNMPARRPNTCCTACARRSTCCSRKGWRTCSGATQLLAEAVRRAVGVWAEGQVIGFNIIEPSERCNTVTPGADQRRTTPMRCAPTATRSAA